MNCASGVWTLNEQEKKLHRKVDLKVSKSITKSTRIQQTKQDGYDRVTEEKAIRGAGLEDPNERELKKTIKVARDITQPQTARTRALLQDVEKQDQTKLTKKILEALEEVEIPTLGHLRLLTREELRQLSKDNF